VSVGVLTVKAMALLQTLPCWTWALPVTEPEATVATLWVLVQLTMLPASLLPSHTLPLPWLAPKLVPVKVTWVPATPLVGVMLVRLGVGTVKGMALLQTPFCWTCALPEAAFAATTATTWVSLQLTIEPAALLPSQMLPLPWVAPKLVPVKVTWVPGKPLVGVMLVMFGAMTVKGME